MERILLFAITLYTLEALSFRVEEAARYGPIWLDRFRELLMFVWVGLLLGEVYLLLQ